MESSPFEKAIEAWADIGFADLQKTLDSQGSEIVETQKKSLVSRKELAGRTKTFRKLEDPEKLVEIKNLLKMYQTEVDSLTNRSKFAETAFLNVYKLLAEAPDPKPLLEASVDSVNSASELARLSAENAALNDRLTRFADYENIKSKLLKVEMESIEISNNKVAAKEAELKAIFDEKERNWLSSKRDLERQVEDARQQIKDLRANQEVAEARLSVAQSSSDPSQDASLKTGARLAELELVASDLERANMRSLDIEKRNLDLRKELETLRSGTRDLDIKASLEEKISKLESENLLLAAQLESNRSQLERNGSAHLNKLESLERDLSRKTHEIETLRENIKRTQDYDEIKHELDIIKSIEFSIDMDEEVEAVEGTSASAQPLEKMLLARNKKLSNDLTGLRVANSSLTSQISELKQSLEKVSKELESTKTLNDKLEEDLLASGAGAGGSTPSVVGGAGSVVNGWGGGTRSISGRSGRVSPTSSIIGGREPREYGSSGPDNSILPIITQQRDRFRARNAELEDELRKNWTVLNSLRKEIEAVKKDNVELYEKAKYISSYKSGPNQGATVDDRYRSAYEEGLSPFQQFRGKESERALSKMGPVERILFSFTRVVLANRFSRNLFAIYCLGLHALVMGIIMYSVSNHAVVSPETPLWVASADHETVGGAIAQNAEPQG